MRFPAPSEATPNAFNRGNVVERLIGTRVMADDPWQTSRHARGHGNGSAGESGRRDRLRSQRGFEARVKALATGGVGDRERGSFVEQYAAGRVGDVPCGRGCGGAEPLAQRADL